MKILGIAIKKEPLVPRNLPNSKIEREEKKGIENISNFIVIKSPPSGKLAKNQNKLKKGLKGERVEARPKEMNQIVILLIIFSLLFIFANKNTDKLLNYVGIILTIAMLIMYQSQLYEVDGEYIPYTLILVQISAITIIFGFVMMLFASRTNTGETINPLWLIIIVPLLFCIVLYFPEISEISDIHESTDKLKNIQHNTILVLRKLGHEIYIEETGILKIAVLAAILLILIIALFFLL